MTVKILSAHQPNFIPWLGFFMKISQSDLFVFSDDVLYTKQQSINRALFLTASGEEYIFSVPVSRSSGSRVFEKQISYNDARIFSKALARLSKEYKHRKYFDQFSEILEMIRTKFFSINGLSEFNISVINELCSILGIHLDYRLGCDLGLQEFSSNERLLQRANSLGIMSYLHGHGASGYQNDNYLKDNGMTLKKVDYSGLTIFGDHANYSILHLIAEFGVESIRNELVCTKKIQTG